MTVHFVLTLLREMSLQATEALSTQLKTIQNENEKFSEKAHSKEAQDSERISKMEIEVKILQEKLQESQLSQAELKESFATVEKNNTELVCITFVNVDNRY